MSATLEPVVETPAAGVVAASPERPAEGGRLVSMDTYRGFVMLLMASEGLGITTVAKRLPDSALWQALAYQFDHVQWTGCALWDLIQPSFTFLVGVAMPFSLASRAAKGQPYSAQLKHAAFRSIALILLGIFLRSMHKPQTYFTFEDTLTQIGLGYFFLFLLAGRTRKVQAGALAAILIGYWLAFAVYPLPAANTDWAAIGVKPDFVHPTGFAAHWDKNTNFAHHFDLWFLNLFPREKPFAFNGGGYLTLSFIPTLGTMIFGLLCGGLIRGRAQGDGRKGDGLAKVRTMVAAGIGCLVVGWLIGWVGLCPVVKRIWSPSWTIYSAGWCFLLMAFFYGVIELKGRKRWAFPLIVVGMNSIAMYVFAHIFYGMIRENLKTNLGQNFFDHAGIYAPVFESATILFVLWLITLWMYRRRVFLRI